MTLGKLYLGASIMSLVVGIANRLARSEEEKIKAKEEKAEALEQLRVLIPALAEVLESINPTLLFVIGCFIPIIHFGTLFVGVQEIIDAFKEGSK